MTDFLINNTSGTGESLALIDSHCHFDFDAFSQDRHTLWRECRAQGINRLIIPGVAPDQWQKAHAIAHEYAGVFYSAGLHPEWMSSYLVTRNKAGENKEGLLGNKLKQLSILLETELKDSRCLAIGETGLDKRVDLNLEMQALVVQVHIDLAIKLHKPLILHAVQAHNELLQLLAAAPKKLQGVIHGFTGSYETAMQYWRLGFLIGVGGSITYERAHKTRQAVSQVPLESLLLETDAPDMPLAGFQGQRNSPLALLTVAQTLAELRADSVASIATTTSDNAKKLFNIF